MHVEKVDAGNRLVSQWSGGTTTQLAIEPPGACYGDRSFLWRLSSATVELPESDFTPLPDYHRILMILRGNLQLSHDGGGEISLGELDQDRFDGASLTKSRGRVVDFNLMLRKGVCEGKVQAKALSPGEVWSGCAPNVSESSTFFAYCFQGSLTVRCPDREPWALEAGEGIRMDRKAGEPELSWRIEHSLGSGDAVVVIAEILTK